MPVIDFEEDAQQDQLNTVADASALSDQVVKLKNVEDAIIATEQQLKDLKKQADKLSQEVIPTMMQEMNLSTLKLHDGSAVEVKPFVFASIPSDKKDAAYDWLRANGLGDIIKNEITVAFGKEEDAKAAEYANLAQGQGYEPSQKLKVEPSTLRAMVRERIESGSDVPSDLFNVFSGQKTKITRK